MELIQYLTLNLTFGTARKVFDFSICNQSVLMEAIFLFVFCLLLFNLIRQKFIPISGIRIYDKSKSITIYKPLYLKSYKPLYLKFDNNNKIEHSDINRLIIPLSVKSHTKYKKIYFTYFTLRLRNVEKESQIPWLV